MNAYIGERLAGLGADPDPIDVLRTVARAFLPIDEVSRRSMLVYHGFAAAALTDPALRASEMFTNGRGLIGFFATQLALIRNDDARARPRSRRRCDRPAVAPARTLDRRPPRADDRRRSHRGVGRPPRPTHELTPGRPTLLTTVASGGVVPCQPTASECRNDLSARCALLRRERSAAAWRGSGRRRCAGMSRTRGER